jgi:hypothetical protein
MQSEQLAKQIASCGFNAVRFHLYTDWLVKRDSPVDSWFSGKSTAELDPVQLDKFHYLLHCLKKNGVYYMFPLAAWGHINAGVINDVEEYQGKNVRFDFSGLYPISKDAMRYLCDFSVNLLCSRNPYTKMAVKDDPALLSIETSNENSPFAVLGHHPQLIDVYRRKCKEYLRGQGKKNATAEQVEQFLPEYVLLMHENGFRELKAFLREHGVNKPINDMDFRNNLVYAIARSQAEMDYVDIHGYWDLYKKVGKSKSVVPYRLRYWHPIEGKWWIVLSVGAGRIFGKPFCSGEYNTCYPSPYWSYMVPSEAAIALLQNWSGIFLCGYNPYPEEVFTPAPAQYIRSFNPLVVSSVRIGGKLMLNHELQPLALKIPFVVTPDYLYEKLDIKGGSKYPRKYYEELGWRCQIGTVLVTDKTDLSGYPCVVIPDDMEIPDRLKQLRCYKADDQLLDNLNDILFEPMRRNVGCESRQVELDSQKKSLKLLTAQSECFMLPEDLDSLQGNVVNVAGNENTSTCFVTSLDEKILAESRRILALYITDLKNTDSVVEYPANGGCILKEMGTMPYLLRQGDISITVKTRNSDLPQIWSLKYDGSRSVPVHPLKTETGFTFSAQAVTNEDTYFAYEIMW